MNSEAFLSILAMDSYQRGYASGIERVGGTHIGFAEILPDSEQRPEITGGEAVGFYAVAYEFSGSSVFTDGEKVISYRGTEFDIGNGLTDQDGIVSSIQKTLNGEFVADLTNGWSTFTGLGDRSQFPLARTFFQAVSGGDFNDGVTYNNIIVTGHSLGGALAGYVDARVDIKSYLVDPIPYVVDYTVELTDRDGTFYVWARNLDRALELEWKIGDCREFNLRPGIGGSAGRRPTAANDNDAWRGATFTSMMGRAA